jgi:hypothetical protein
MRKPKPKVHKHLAFDADIFERAEEKATAENKSLNEWMNEAARYRLEMTEEKPQPQLQLEPQRQQHPTNTPTLTLSEANSLIRDKLIPSIGNNDQLTIEDKDSLVSLYKALKVLLELVEINLNKRRRLEFAPIPYLSPFEQARQEGLKKAREMRDKHERAELMSALPQPIEVMQEIDTDASSITATDATIALTTSSTINPHLTEAEFLALKQQQETRDRRLKELAEEMRAKAKDIVKLVDESKEIPPEEDIPMSPADGNEGVQEDREVPQEDF